MGKRGRSKGRSPSGSSGAGWQAMSQYFYFEECPLMGECSSQKAEKSRIAKIKNEASKEQEEMLPIFIYAHR